MRSLLLTFLRSALILAIFLNPNQLLGQTGDYTNVPLSRAISDEYEQHAMKARDSFHSAFKPYRYDQLKAFVSEDTFYQFDTLPGTNWIERAWNGFSRGHLLSVEKPDFALHFDALLDFSVGQEFDAEWTSSTNTRGINMKGSIGKKFSFESSFRETQGRFPIFIQRFIYDYQVVPGGQGRVRRFQPDSTTAADRQVGFDYSQATGYISYSPSRFVNFQFGQGKHFIGDGYRSLLLSDNSFSYPYFRISTRVWKLQYDNLFTQFQDLTGGSNFVTGFQKKFGSFHYLSYAPTSWLQVGLFEGIIWQASDSTNYRGFDLAYLNPIIFYRPVEFGLGSPDNAIMGANLKLQPFDKVAVYGQFVLDDLDIARSREGDGFYRNKFGWQLGVKWMGAFDIENLILRSEFNQVKPFTYAHKDEIQNYAHYNQALAHPLGANFQEWISSVGYRKKRFYTDVVFQYAVWGADSAGSHLGQNIFISDFEIRDFPESYGHEIKQGVRTELFGVDMRVGYIVNPTARLAFELNLKIRNLEDEMGMVENTRWLNFSLRTNVFNRGLDY